jgi:hypothetical protein
VWPFELDAKKLAAALRISLAMKSSLYSNRGGSSSGYVGALKYHDQAAGEQESNCSQNHDFCVVAHFQARVPHRKFMAVCTGLLCDLQSFDRSVAGSRRWRSSSPPARPIYGNAPRRL